MRYIFFGNFTPFRTENILWRLHMLKEIFDGRRETIPLRIQYGAATPHEGNMAKQLFETLQIWIVVTSEDEKQVLSASLRTSPKDILQISFRLMMLRMSYRNLKYNNQIKPVACRVGKRSASRL